MCTLSEEQSFKIGDQLSGTQALSTHIQLSAIMCYEMQAYAIYIHINKCNMDILSNLYTYHLNNDLLFNTLFHDN